VGQRLGERYVLKQRLAVGGMGEVWTAHDEKLNRAVAVKVLRLDLAPDTAFQRRFRAEARTAAALSHGGIAAVYDYGEALGSAYLVMELVPGEPLSAMIAREGALGTDRTLQIVSQSARALHAAHRHGVVHRDIKPANLMITPELRVKVTDFGIARPRDHEPLTATGQVMGTAHYLAPELARGEIASPLSDVYALGVVAYECLAGWRPFDGDNQIEVATAHLQDEPPPLPGTVPGPVRDLVMAAMAKNPAARPQGAQVLAAMAEDLRLGRVSQPPGDTRASGGRGRAEARQVTPHPSLAPFTAWPADAETPPRGSRAAQHATRRGLGDGAVKVPMRTPTLSLPIVGAGRGEGGRRRLTVPLAALIALIALIVAGALWAGRSDAAEPAGPVVTSSQSTEADGSVARVARGPQHVQGSIVTPGGSRTEGWTR
jgi:serine/threonine-protein kinase